MLDYWCNIELWRSLPTSAFMRADLQTKKFNPGASISKKTYFRVRKENNLLGYITNNAPKMCCLCNSKSQINVCHIPYYLLEYSSIL